MKVLQTACVVISRQGVSPHQTMIGQLTKCQTASGELFYTREGLSAAHSFLVSSGQRQGEKDGSIAPYRQVLLLATEGDWDAIAALVHQADALHRRVVRSRRFTLEIAERQLTGGVHAIR